MNIICIIPARGGSKRMPRKNVRIVAGLPLVVHSMRHARATIEIAETYVSTDDPEVAELARREGVTAVERPVELSGDAASSESALLHVLDDRRKQGMIDPDLVVFLQPTSPVRRVGDISAAIEALRSASADSLFSATINKALIWNSSPRGLESINYNFCRRQREQDMSVQYRENGSIYVFRPEILREKLNRLGGRIAVFEMDVWTSFQVDEEADLELCAWILARPEFVTGQSAGVEA
jgi:CMP-N,N'-diacetyllegionaminic acid synthase